MIISKLAWAGWLWRRVQELVGLVTLLYPLYAAMPPDKQAVIQAVLTGQGGGLSISAAIGFLLYAVTQWQSFRATTRPQIVKTDGEKVLPAEKHEVDTAATIVTPKRRKTLATMLGLGR